MYFEKFMKAGHKPGRVGDGEAYVPMSSSGCIETNIRIYNYITSTETGNEFFF